jgi:PAS domain S-box-containing protein
LLQDYREGGGEVPGLQRRITELEARLECLQDSDRRLRLFVDSVRDYAFIALDTNNCVTGWNAGAERILGYQESEILGQSGSLIFTPEDIENGNMQLEFDTARQTGRAEDERWHVRKDKSRFWGSGVLARIDDEAGNFIGFGKVMRDLTERNAREQRSLLTVQENERRRIARELHDDLVQRLAVLEIGLARIRRDLPPNAADVGLDLLRLEQQTGILSNDVRRLSHQLHPSVLDDLGLCAALESAVEEFQDDQGQGFTYVCEGVPEKIPANIATTIYRIAQEALRNIVKHASGPGLLSVIGDGSSLRLTVSDAGPGFDVLSSFRGGLGILSMKERALLVGGQFSITSNPGGSTTIEVTLPIQEGS